MFTSINKRDKRDISPVCFISLEVYVFVSSQLFTKLLPEEEKRGVAGHQRHPQLSPSSFAIKWEIPIRV